MLPAILSALSARHLPATFFLEGACAQACPDEVKEVARAGHEVGAHGWVHERWAQLPEDEEARLLTRAGDALESVVSHRPRGFRPPSGDPTPATRRLLVRTGWLYLSAAGGRDDVRRGEAPFLRGRVDALGVRTASWGEVVTQWAEEPIHGTYVLHPFLVERGPLEGFLDAVVSSGAEVTTCERAVGAQAARTSDPFTQE